jgi:hypothetical protein
MYREAKTLARTTPAISASSSRSAAGFCGSTTYQKATRPERSAIPARDCHRNDPNASDAAQYGVIAARTSRQATPTGGSFSELLAPAFDPQGQKQCRFNEEGWKGGQHDGRGDASLQGNDISRNRAGQPE